jgi:hypothetical protein
MSENKSVVEKQPYITVEGGLPGEDPREKFRYLDILVHADYGTGKTTFASSACDDSRTAPVLVLDFEGGAALRFMEKDPSTYTIRRIRSVNDLNAIYEYLAKGNHPYKSVVVDSLTEIQKLGLFEFVYGTDKVTNAFKGDILNIKTAEIQHWGKSHNQVAMMIRYFRDLPIHSIFTTLTQTVKDELTGKISYTVALPGKQADEIPGIPDIVGYMHTIKQKEGLVRVMDVQPDGRVKAKDRTNALGPGVMNPTVPKMLDMIWKKYGIEE